MAARRLILLVAALAVAGSAGAAGLEAQAGRALFERNWVTAPSSVAGHRGLGPHYDARACSACHADAGPGAVGPDRVGAGMAVRLATSAGAPDPVYGSQLQTKAVTGAQPEARMEFAWIQAALGRRPALRVTDLAYGPLSPSVHTGLRRAPALAGLALLDDVPLAEIERRADPNDRNHDGVSGRISLVAGEGGRPRLGRWGWKAAQPGLRRQMETSLLRDIGVTTAGGRAGGEETLGEIAQDRAISNSAAADAPAAATAALVDYLRSLPAPQPLDPRSPGAALFGKAGCGACHAVLRGADGRPVAAYTDLLLHDMGPGLDDGVGEGRALSQEWRTAPLWTVGAELGRGGLLHDGRARTIAEAVRWHGGEAARSRRRFEALPQAQQRAVAAFLGGW